MAKDGYRKMNSFIHVDLLKLFNLIPLLIVQPTQAQLINILQIASIIMLFNSI